MDERKKTQNLASSSERRKPEDVDIELEPITKKIKEEPGISITTEF